MPRGRPRFAPRTIAMVAGAVLLVVAALLTALGDPVSLVARPRSTESAQPPSLNIPFQPDATVQIPRGEGTGTPDGPQDFSLLMQMFVALMALAIIAAAIAVAHQLWLRRRRLEISKTRIPTPGEIPEELLESTDEGLAQLAGGSPRNAIVSAWATLENAAAQVGLPRDPAETSTEYTQRVLGTWPVNRRHLIDFAALYREARFSIHDLTETHREQAIEHLTEFRRELGALSARAPEPTTPSSGGPA